jgi:hypothetical protein
MIPAIIVIQNCHQCVATTVSAPMVHLILINHYLSRLLSAIHVRQCRHMKGHFTTDVAHMMTYYSFTFSNHATYGRVRFIIAEDDENTSTSRYAGPWKGSSISAIGHLLGVRFGSGHAKWVWNDLGCRCPAFTYCFQVRHTCAGGLGRKMVSQVPMDMQPLSTHSSVPVPCIELHMYNSRCHDPLCAQ